MIDDARRVWIVITMLAAASLLAPAASAGRVVYTSDFENSAGKEWSADKIEVTPQGNQRFLGGFTAEKVAFKLEKLPAHKYVRISLDLYVIANWDGNATVNSEGVRVGPDAWRMWIENGVTLVDATFSNTDFESPSAPPEAMRQSYPSVLHGEAFPAKTGAAASNTLGFAWVTNGGVQRQADSVYRLSFVIRHEAGDIQFNFQGTETLQAGENGFWGLDNVKVEALDEGEVKKLDNAEMRRLWEAVGGHDVVTETESFWKLVAGGDDVARFLREKVKRIGIDRTQFDKYLRELDGDDFQLRERATRGLREMGLPIASLLRDAIGKTDSAEAKVRLQAILKGIESAPPADLEMRRYAIALKLLEAIGTPEAERVRDDLGGK